MSARVITGLGILLAAVLHARPASAVQIVDGDFHVDIVPAEDELACVTMPESLYDPEACVGVNVGIVNERVQKSLRGGLTAVASVLVRGDVRVQFVLVLRDDKFRTEFDKDTANAFVQGGVHSMHKLYGEDAMSGVGNIEPMMMRRNGVQLVGYEVTALPPAGDVRRSMSSLVAWTAATKRGRYSISFATSPEETPQARALAERSLPTLHATPASRPPTAIVHMIMGAAMLGGVLLALVVGVFFLIRTLMKRPSQAPKTYYGYNAPPPPPPAA